MTHSVTRLSDNIVEVRIPPIRKPESSSTLVSRAVAGMLGAATSALLVARYYEGSGKLSLLGGAALTVGPGLIAAFTAKTSEVALVHGFGVGYTLFLGMEFGEIAQNMQAASNQMQERLKWFAVPFAGIAAMLPFSSKDTNSSSGVEASLVSDAVEHNPTASAKETPTTSSAKEEVFFFDDLQKKGSDLMNSVLEQAQNVGVAVWDKVPKSGDEALTNINSVFEQVKNSVLNRDLSGFGALS